MLGDIDQHLARAAAGPGARAALLLPPRRRRPARVAGAVLGLALAVACGVLVLDRYQRAQLVDSLGQAMRREALLLSRCLNLALQDKLQLLRDAAARPVLSSGLMEAGDMRLLLRTILGDGDGNGRIVLLARNGAGDGDGDDAGLCHGFS